MPNCFVGEALADSGSLERTLFLSSSLCKLTLSTLKIKKKIIINKIVASSADFIFLFDCNNRVWVLNHNLSETEITVFNIGSIQVHVPSSIDCFLLKCENKRKGHKKNHRRRYY